MANGLVELIIQASACEFLGIQEKDNVLIANLILIKSPIVYIIDGRLNDERMLAAVQSIWYNHSGDIRAFKS